VKHFFFVFYLIRRLSPVLLICYFFGFMLILSLKLLQISVTRAYFYLRQDERFTNVWFHCFASYSVMMHSGISDEVRMLPEYSFWV
jgi:hypothetical protein